MHCSKILGPLGTAFGGLLLGLSNGAHAIGGACVMPEKMNVGTVTQSPLKVCYAGYCTSVILPTPGPFSGPVFVGTTNVACPEGQGYQITVTGTYAPQGVVVYPRYVIVGVTYAPPGPQSFVTYSASGTVGTTLTSNNSFNSTTTASVSTSGSGSLLGFSGGKATATVSTTLKQTSSTSNSTTLSVQNTSTTKTAGPSNAYAPVDHDYDIIWVWLNPVAQYVVTTTPTNSVQFEGFGFDMADEPTADVWPVYVGELNGHFAMEAGTSAEFTRAWAANGKYFPAGDGPAITAADYANMLAADPFTNSAYSFSVNSSSNPVTTTDGRFSLASSAQGAVQQVDYVPGVTTTYSLATSNSSTTGSSAQHSFSTTFSVDVSFASNALFLGFASDLKASEMLTWTHTQGSSVTTSTLYSNALSVSGPCTTPAGCSPAYTGPSIFDIYQDNVWGTFYFDPIR